MNKSNVFLQFRQCVKVNIYSNLNASGTAQAIWNLNSAVEITPAFVRTNTVFHRNSSDMLDGLMSVFVNLQAEWALVRHCESASVMPK